MQWHISARLAHLAPLQYLTYTSCSQSSGELGRDIFKGFVVPARYLLSKSSYDSLPIKCLFELGQLGRIVKFGNAQISSRAHGELLVFIT